MSIHEKLKQVLIEGLNLEEVTAEEIDHDAPLFGEGLGLDSLDAVEVVLIVKKNFNIEIKDRSDAEPAMKSINALATFIEERQGAN